MWTKTLGSISLAGDDLGYSRTEPSSPTASLGKISNRDGFITHGQRGTNRSPPGGGGYELWVKDHILGIMAKLSDESWI